MRAKLIHWLRTWAWWVINMWPDHAEDRLHAHSLLADRTPEETELDYVVRAACLDCGVSLSGYASDLDLGHKAVEVLHHASTRLGTKIRTVEDVKALLGE